MLKLVVRKVINDGKRNFDLVLSPNKEEAEKAYTVKNFNDDFTFSGARTNDAPVPYCFKRNQPMRRF